MSDGNAIFDIEKTRATIEKGRRAKWWKRKGGRASGFKYFDCEGKPITGIEDLERIEALVIPPAWKHVRVCPTVNGRLQVVGMDGKGRVQYRYHPAYARRMEREKFAKTQNFGEFLPKLRGITSEHLSLEGLPMEKVLAAMVRLMDTLYFRVGTALSERHYKTYGITTLDKKHLVIKPKGKLEFQFVGKSHVKHRLVLVDDKLAVIVKEIAALPRGRKLFRYVDEIGKIRTVKPAQINRYLKEATDPMFSSKDFRTWGGTLMAAVQLAKIGISSSPSEIKNNVVKAVKKVARELGNTPAVCRSSYIHPAVIEHYNEGTTLSEFMPMSSRRVRKKEIGLRPEEEALIRLLKS